MKKYSVTILIAASLLLTAGCGKKPDAPAPSAEGNHGDSAAPSGLQNDNGSAVRTDSQDNDTSAPQAADLSPNDETGQNTDRETYVSRLRIVDGVQSGFLFLAGENSGEVYTLSLEQDIPVYLDGNQKDTSALEDGMIIDLAFDGTVMETFPAQFGQVFSINAYSLGTEQNPGGGYYDLCGLYLQVLNDLWDADPGLNSNIACVSIDLSQAPGELTESEKQAIAWIFAGSHNVEALTFSYDELLQNGYLTAEDTEGSPELYCWEDGVLFTITPGQWEKNEIYSLPVLKFNAEKWRSPRGAYFFTDCFTLWPEMGTWSSYEIGGEAIS